MTISATVAFGYFLNDVTDRAEDKRAGKSNVSVGLSASHIILIFILLSVLALAPWYFLPKSATNLTLYGLQILLLLIYSIPPLRLKRFPVPAVIIDALYNSVVPFLVIFSTFILISPEKVKIHPVIWGLIIAWAFLKGFRGILLHQVKDRKNDKRAGVQTFVLKFGPRGTINLVSRVTLPAETGLFVALIGILSVSSFPFLWILLLLFGNYVFFYLRLWERHPSWWKKESNSSYLYIINDLYEEWLPIATLIYLPFLNPWYLLLFPLHGLLFHRSFIKILRNFQLNQKNYTDFRKYLMRRKYDAISIMPSSSSVVLSDENKVVHGLWIGNRLSVIELLTIQSFLANGHDFHLWTYADIENLPDGVTVRDANEIIPKNEIIVRKFNDPVTGVGKGSVGAPFSDLFRYKLLYEQGGWWVDMDITCLKPLQFDEPYFFRDHLLLDVIGNVMKCPKGSELMLRAYQETRATCNEDTLDWLLPNKILNKHIQELSLLKYRKNNLSNRDEWPETKKYINTLRKIPDNWYVIHWSNEEWRVKGIDKNHLRISNSTLGFLLERIEVPYKKAEFFKMLKNDLKLMRPFSLSIPSVLYASPIVRLLSRLNWLYHTVKVPFNKFYWVIHGHAKYYIDKYIKRIKQ